MYISEIFTSIQGEGVNVGKVATFLRTHGCNLYNLSCPCVWCDTEYSYKLKRKKMNLGLIMDSVARLGNKHVCITGGEPLMQEEVYPLIYELLYNGYTVEVFTNGTIPIEKPSVNRSYSYVMDVKLSSSRKEGAIDHNCYPNIRKLRRQDSLKFVISNEQDYNEAKEILSKYPTYAQVFFSPLDGDTLIANMIVENLVRDKLDARLGLQIHKIIGVK